MDGHLLEKLKLSGRKFYNIFSLSPTRIIVVGFLGLVFLGTVILALPISSKSGSSIGFANALFTATSAVCVTGLVVVDTATYWSPMGKIVILVLIQTGALGIMSLVTLFSFVTGKKLGLKERLTMQESFNMFTLSGVVKTFKSIAIATVFLELIGAALISIRMIPLIGIKEGVIKSVFHSISAFCNAGFDIYGTESNKFISLSNFGDEPLILMTTSMLIIVGGLGFIVWRDIATKKRFINYTLHTKIVLIATVILIVLGSIATFALEYNNPYTLKDMSILSKADNSFFHSVASRTAGFNVLSIGQMKAETRLLTVILMFIGAAPGSTAGGIKVTTISVIIFSVIAFLKQRDDVHVMKNNIAHNVVLKSTAIFIMGVLIVIFGTIVLLINNNINLDQALFEVTSAFGTVGLSTGITPELNTLSKFVISGIMFLGRVGPISAALAFSMGHKHTKSPYKYVDGKITVG